MLLIGRRHWHANASEFATEFLLTYRLCSVLKVTVTFGFCDLVNGVAKYMWATCDYGRGVGSCWLFLCVPSLWSHTQTRTHIHTHIYILLSLTLQWRRSSTYIKMPIMLLAPLVVLHALSLYYSGQQLLVIYRTLNWYITHKDRQLNNKGQIICMHFFEYFS